MPGGSPWSSRRAGARGGAGRRLSRAPWRVCSGRARTLAASVGEGSVQSGPVASRAQAAPFRWSLTCRLLKGEDAPTAESLPTRHRSTPRASAVLEVEREQLVLDAGGQTTELHGRSRLYLCLPHCCPGAGRGGRQQPHRPPHAARVPWQRFLMPPSPCRRPTSPHLCPQPQPGPPQSGPSAGTPSPHPGTGKQK